MKAIVFADRIGAELSPLNDKSCVALLPFAAKPVVEYTLEQLLLAKIKQVFLVVAEDATEVERYINSSHYWDLDIEYVLSRGEEDPTTLIPRIGKQLEDDCYLLIRGDILHNVNITQLIDDLSHAEGSSAVTYRGNLVGVMQWKPALTLHSETTLLSWAHLGQDTPTLPSDSTVQPYEIDTPCCYIRSLKGYHAGNIVAIAQQFQNMTLPGYQWHAHLQVGQHSQVNEHHSGLVGAYCYVHRNASLSAKVVLCDRVVVNRNTVIDNSIVLPDTYIGENLNINNAIVWGNTIIRIDTPQPVVLTLPQARWTADMRQTNLLTLFNNWSHCVLGIVISILVLPLLPIAALLAWIQNPQQPLQAKQMYSNHYTLNEVGVTALRAITVWEWQTSIPLLRHLPKLLAVIRGDWQLVGITPKSVEEHDKREVNNLALPYYYGLICPSHLCDPGSSIERDLIDQQYAKTRHLGRDLYWLGYGFLRCFTPLAWVKKT